MFGWYIDPVYFWYVFIPTLVISIGVQIYLKATHAKWSQVKNHNNMAGVQVGQELFSRTSLKAIPLEHVSGTLSDHFDPKANVVRLSNSVYANQSVAAMAVTAHELGHVQQYQTGSGLIKARGIFTTSPAVQSDDIVYRHHVWVVLEHDQFVVDRGCFFCTDGGFLDPDTAGGVECQQAGNQTIAGSGFAQRSAG